MKELVLQLLCVTRDMQVKAGFIFKGKPTFSKFDLIHRKNSTKKSGYKIMIYMICAN